ncbi:DUF5819 family protein [Chryseobacterium fistulae]|uniref:Uncharacterized protein n=1 Tax=Chryseobacterium fistulae TaxID=2675058 RepID=A0A6N4XR73_9FLAO|nr:DUF5819 family protein [Chryseobacterium fistulae]CAA7386119.1 hypothetical protein CHRY9393_00410 [Chryseobacterium fistulae]
MKNIAVFITFCLFIAYWSLTLFFTFPENPMNVRDLKYRQYFEAHFYQNWSFFAPPATFNERLYFSYIYNDPITNTKKVRTFETLVPITQEKKKKAPFNRKQDVLDYVICGSVHEVQNKIKEVYDIIKVEEKRNQKSSSIEEKNKKVIEEIEKTESFHNLQNYAKIVAEKNGIPKNDTQYKITITNIDIPKYVNKSSQTKREEKTVISSNLHPLKTTK